MHVNCPRNGSCKNDTKYIIMLKCIIVKTNTYSFWFNSIQFLSKQKSYVRLLQANNCLHRCNYGLNTLQTHSSRLSVLRSCSLMFEAIQDYTRCMACLLFDDYPKTLPRCIMQISRIFSQFIARKPSIWCKMVDVFLYSLIE